jgi:hypothetical protein
MSSKMNWEKANKNEKSKVLIGPSCLGSLGRSSNKAGYEASIKAIYRAPEPPEKEKPRLTEDQIIQLQKLKVYLQKRASRKKTSKSKKET